MWKKVLREYFAFPKKERQGLFVLFIIWFVIIIYKWFSVENHKVSEWKILIQTDSIINASEKKYFNDKYLNPNHDRIDFKKLTKNLRDTNYDELKQLGISSKTSSIIMKFITSGATLEDKKSIDKVYGINEDEKEILLNSFLFKDYSRKENFIKSNDFEKIDINICDSNSLESLPRIGPALSSRIIKYRNRLGGFISTSQLLEVYGLDSSVLNTIESKIKVDIRSIKKIKINESGFDELSKFPYIGYKLARIIINYREQHGSYKSKEDLLKIHLMNHKIIDKLEPYIDFTHEH